MSEASKANGALVSGMILLAVACICIGYGLAKVVNGLDGGIVPLGVGTSMSGLATILVTRAASAKSD